MDYNDNAARTHAHEQGIEAERDAYIERQVSEIMGYFPQLCEYLPDWLMGAVQLVYNIEKGLLQDEDYHHIHGEACEQITKRLEGEIK